MDPRLFRLDIDSKEEADFIAHARANYKIGDPINPTHHPIWAHEAALMNLEVWKEARGPKVLCTYCQRALYGERCPFCGQRNSKG